MLKSRCWEVGADKESRGFLFYCSLKDLGEEGAWDSLNGVISSFSEAAGGPPVG